jgi:Ni/Co efflux regulator RcnB
MKRMLAAMAAILTLAAVGAASAQDWPYGDRDRGEWRGDRDDDRWRGRDDGWRGDRHGSIMVRDLRGRMHTFDRRDWEWDTLVRSPFGMRPGLVYIYTDDCRRGQCQVYIYERGSRRSLGHLWAPTLNDPRYFSYARDRYGNDPWDDRRIERILD